MHPFQSTAQLRKLPSTITEGKNAKALIKNPNHVELAHVKVMQYILHNTTLDSYKTIFNYTVTAKKIAV